jgi:hypothetical protein
MALSKRTVAKFYSTDPVILSRRSRGVKTPQRHRETQRRTEKKRRMDVLTRFSILCLSLYY